MLCAASPTLLPFWDLQSSGHILSLSHGHPQNPPQGTAANKGAQPAFSIGTYTHPPPHFHAPRKSEINSGLQKPLTQLQKPQLTLFSRVSCLGFARDAKRALYPTPVLRNNLPISSTSFQVPADVCSFPFPHPDTRGFCL